MVMKDASSISRRSRDAQHAGHQDAGAGNKEPRQPSGAGDRRVLGDDPGRPPGAYITMMMNSTPT
jgi:hypothetical protein